MKKVKVNKLLLSKYYANRCTKAEKEAVEAWLKADDLNESLEMSKEEKSQIKESIWRAISLENNFKGENLRPWFRKGIQVAAAACFLFGSFFGGRLSAKTVSIEKGDRFTYKEHLYVYGGKDIVVDLPGDEFKMYFEGTAQLYNGSANDQIIVVGDTTLLLSSHKTYYLIGSTSNPEFLDESTDIGFNGLPTPDLTEFSIIRKD